MERGVWVGWSGFSADFCDLALGVGNGILRRQRLRAEEWRKNREEDCWCKRFHRDTIAEDGVVL